MVAALWRSQMITAADVRGWETTLRVGLSTVGPGRAILVS
jgi:hypothetical protein